MISPLKNFYVTALSLDNCLRRKILTPVKQSLRFVLADIFFHLFVHFLFNHGKDHQMFLIGRDHALRRNGENPSCKMPFIPNLMDQIQKICI